MSEYIDFRTEIPLDKMDILIDLGQEFSFDPTSSIESEKYFIKLLEKYKEYNNDELKKVLKEVLKKDFKLLNEQPDWIQDPEWQFNNGVPMIFVGQIEVKQNRKVFHDDAIFYVFWDSEDGETKTIIQLS